MEKCDVLKRDEVMIFFLWRALILHVRQLYKWVRLWVPLLCRVAQAMSTQQFTNVGDLGKLPVEMSPGDSWFLPLAKVLAWPRLLRWRQTGPIWQSTFEAWPVPMRGVSSRCACRIATRGHASTPNAHVDFTTFKNEGTLSRVLCGPGGRGATESVTVHL